MGLKRVSWVRRYQGQCRALRPLGHQGCRLRNHKKDQPLCSGYTEAPPAEIYISECQESTGFFYHNVSVIFQPSVLMVNVSATVSWLAILR